MDNNNVALITKMVLEAVEKQKSSEKEPGYLVPVGVSARHIHLTQEHVEALFGPGWADSLPPMRQLQLSV